MPRALSRYKGGIIVHNGYVMLWRPEHPRAWSTGYVSRAICVAEEKLGRALKKGEVVHHINHIRDDDRPENIHVFPSQSEHIGHHNRSIRRPKKLSEAEAREIKRLLSLPQTPRIRKRHRTGRVGRPHDPNSILSIARQFGLSWGSVKAIADGRSFAWVQV